MTFEEELERYGHLVFTNKGVSMMPLLRQDRDLMVLEKRPEGRLHKYDAVLFKRQNGQYVLHRILKVRETDYLICGDNCYQLEPVTEQQILGRMTTVVRDGKTIPVTSRAYQLYVHLWCDFYPVRAFLLRVRGVLGRIKRKVMERA